MLAVVGRIVGLLVLAGCVIAAGVALAGATDRRQTATASAVCGVERWPVKTGWNSVKA